jgi:hypothetical protein
VDIIIPTGNHGYLLPCTVERSEKNRPTICVDTYAYTGLDYEPTTVILGSAELVVVTGIKPRGLDRVEITGVVEDESVHG